jgi:hypothetical protein
VLQGDPHFTQDNRGHFALATKWEWTRYQEPDFPPEMLEALVKNLAGQRQEAESQPALSEADRRIILGIDPIEELKPWLEAVGYGARGAADPDEVDSAREVAARKEQVYQLHVALKRRASTQRLLEARGNNTLVELDRALRRAFRHDTMDHLSGFFVRTGGGRGQEELGTINPLGEVVEGEDLELAELNLEPEDELTYVYDFGDWVEHTIKVEAVVPPQPDVEYPRQVDRRRTGRSRR